MPVKVAIVNDSVPHCYHGGGGVTIYSILRALRDRGMNVRVVALAHSSYNGPSDEAHHIRHLETDLETPVEILSPAQGPKGRRRWPSFQDQFPSLHQRTHMANHLRRIGPDVILGYHWGPLGAIYGISDIPKLGVVGDPVHLPDLFRKDRLRRQDISESWTRRLRELILAKPNLRSRELGMARLLNDCDIAGAFAAHHAEDLRGWGATECRYFRTPTPDPLPPAHLVERGRMHKVMHIGHLKGIATLAGVDLLANGILPILENSLKDGTLELHLVGGFFDQMPRALQEQLTRPAVKVRGQISPPDEEFLSSHVVLVPTPIELGIRVRIITAFSFGSCIVAHTANQLGIPELQDGENCLLGSSGGELAQACLRVLKDSDLRKKLEIGARKTYETKFSLATAGGEIAQSIEELAGMKT